MIEGGPGSRPLVYALLDPRDDQIFYVGQSKQPEQRFYDHLAAAWKNLGGRLWSHHLNAEKDQRIREICMATGRYPVVVLLGRAAEKSEKEWIAELAAAGAPLTNRQHHKKNPSLSANLKSRWADPEYRANGLAVLARARATRKEASGA